MKRLALDTDYLVREYLAGKSEYALALDLGTHRPVIRLRLLEAGIQIRGRREAGLMRASLMSAAERKAQALAANEAARGRKKTFAEQCQAAQTRELRGRGISPLERQLRRLLAERDVATIQQQAIGPYNADLGAHPVAIEIFGGYWHWYGDHARLAPKRFRYFLDAGWHILVVHVVNRFPITAATAEYVISYLDRARSDPALPREYRVIRSTGELIAGGSAQDNHISLVPAFTSGRNALGQYTRVPR